jgi:hypothetical protein
MANRSILILGMLAGAAWFVQAQTTPLKPPESKPAPAPIQISGITPLGGILAGHASG